MKRVENPKQLEIMNEKVQQIRESSHRFNPLHVPLAGMRRVHIGKDFVLIYSMDEHREKLL